MTQKKRLVSRTRPFFNQGLSCAECLRMAGGLLPRPDWQSGPAPRNFRPYAEEGEGGERPCALLLGGMGILLEHAAVDPGLPLLEMVNEFSGRFERHAARELGVRPDSAGWVDCEKVTGIYWEDPEHETPPNKCVLLADKALQDLETIMRQHPVAGAGQ